MVDLRFKALFFEDIARGKKRLSNNFGRIATLNANQIENFVENDLILCRTVSDNKHISNIL